MMHWGTYGWGMGFGWLWMGFVWTLIIGAIAYAVRTASGNTVSHDGGISPLDILKKRYARGELTKQEFDRQREELTR